MLKEVGNLWLHSTML